MSSLRGSQRVVTAAAWTSAALLAAALLGACERRAPSRPTDSATPAAPVVTPPESLVATRFVSGWNRDAGAALLLPGEGGEAFVVVPGEAGDSATDRTAGSATDVLPAEVALLTRAGSAGHALATPLEARPAAGCTAWPAARLGPASGADAMPAWTVGFVGGRPAPIALDSIEAASPGDSATLAAAVTRLAAALPDDTVRTFRGVPFTVRSARRFPLGDAADGVVAVLERALNQEAAPLREQIVLVAERARPAAGAAGAAGAAAPPQWSTAYHERASGREEDVVATEVLAAVALGADRRPTLVLGRALADGTRYTLLERAGERAWRARWTSVVRGC